MAKTKDESATTAESAALQQAASILALAPQIPGIHWILGDNLCDCAFQRIGEWTNPYLAQTLRVRLCCLWQKLYDQFPELVQEIPAFYDENRHIYETQPAPWDSDEYDMPVYLWHRQMAKQQGKSLAQIREEYQGRESERPRKVYGRKANDPTAAEIEHAKRAHLRASGWIV